MMTFVTSVGIIGFGDFGEFLATKLEPHFEVKVSSRRSEAVPEKWRGTFEDVAQCDYIIPSIPLGTYEQVLSRLEPIVRSNTVLVDICSVKLRPIEIIRNVLPKVRLVATHPLFGPQSAADSLDGHTLVICPEVSDTEATSHIYPNLQNP